MAITNNQIDVIINELKTNPNSTGSSYISLSNEDKLLFNSRFNDTITESDLSDPKAYQNFTRIKQYGVPIDTGYMNFVTGAENSKRQTDDANTISSVGVHESDTASFNYNTDSSKLNTSTGGILRASRTQDSGGFTTEIDTNDIVVSGTRGSGSPTGFVNTDRRARLSPKVAVFNDLITTDGIMSPLIETHGLMFPYTPTITENVDVNYESYDLAHGLMPIQAFRSGGQKTLTVDAQFTAQTDIEARYCLACIHFIRSFSKMNFGDTDPNAGTPPPILHFSAYGTAMFSNVPVIISNANFNWPNDVDYVYTRADTPATNSAYTIDSFAINGWVPSKFTISLTLIVQRSPTSMRNFNLTQFRNGDLLGRGWI